ncbi:MAG TPA: site-specific integrase, partial [Opitutaceae bacterium]|nr:site-specific integrase [Opitutaceae bacterium]
MNRSKFFVTQFENSSGTLAWRVEGRINGVRFRRNFKTKEEAAAEKAALEVSAAQGCNLRAIPTSLAEAQVREAEAAFHRLTGRTRTLTFYLDYALANYRDPVQE